MSDTEDQDRPEALGAGAKDSQSGDQMHSPGATRRVVIALVIVVLVVAFAAALSYSGARAPRGRLAPDPGSTDDPGDLGLTDPGVSFPT
jgi:hypothetical protein